MIISASYKTDIPAFYGAWFVNRLAAGFCRMVNPYGGQTYDVPLDRQSVDGFVFWTKNLGPFLAHLGVIRQRGFPFTVQYSINNYPRALESAVTDAERSVGHMHVLAQVYGPRAAVWRYDPVVVTTLTPPAWHIENFSDLARRLVGSTDEVVISFAHVYRKTRRNMDRAARVEGFDWRDPPDEEKRALAAELAAIAADHRIQLTICAQPDLLVPGAEPSRCIDAMRLSDVARQTIGAKTKGNRPGCLCAESRDIGEYDTCPHGCVYCYAVRAPDLAKRRHRAHDSKGVFLFPPGREPGPSGCKGSSDLGVETR